MYVTPQQLAQSPGARELAQLASPAHRDVVAYELMEATLSGQPRDGWLADEIEAADAALARITALIAETDALIDAFIVKRVPAVPLLPVPSVLVTVARAIVRYKLHGDRQGDAGTDPVVRDYKDAMALLAQIRDGKVTLGAGDPAAAGHPGPGDVRFESDPPVFGRKQMRYFR